MSDSDIEVKLEYEESFPSSSGSESSDSDAEIRSDLEDNSDEDPSLLYLLLDGQKWVRFDTGNLLPAPPRFPFLGQPGVKVDIRNLSDPFAFFELFFDKDLIEHIVLETNRYAEQYIAQHDIKKKSRLKSWVAVSDNEMYLFLGVVMLQGLVAKPDVELYWSKEQLIETPFFGKLMSRNRFRQIMKFLHFADNSRSDASAHPNPKLRKIWPVFSYLMKKFSNVYYPDCEVSIDECLMLFNGRLAWVQHTGQPLKRAQFGVKYFVITEAKSGYVWNTIMYTGRETLFDPKYESYGVATKSVMTLVDPLLDNGHCVVSNDFHLSPELADLLVQKKTDVYGTIRSNCRDLPPGFKNIQLNKGEIVAFRRGKVTVLLWRDKKYVSLLSTIHSAETVSSGQSQALVKPAIVVDYNLKMRDVDIVDHALACYPTTRKRHKKYYKCIFRHLIDIAIWNAFILQKDFVRDLQNYDFRKKLILSIVEKFHTGLETHASKRQRCQLERPLRLTARHFPDLVPSTSRKINAARKCAVCCKKTDKKGKKIRRETRYQCSECDVGLCVQPCFRIYHTEKNY